MMKDAPDHLDADLILKLYDLRREAALREARSKLTNEFWPRNAKEAVAVLAYDHPLNRAYRQVSTYWEMVYRMARHGIIHGDFLVENNAEGLLSLRAGGAVSEGDSCGGATRPHLKMRSGWHARYRWGGPPRSGCGPGSRRSWRGSRAQAIRARSASRAVSIVARTRAFSSGRSSRVRPAVSIGGRTSTTARARIEAPVVLGKGGARARHGERQDRHAGLEGQAEGAVLERQHPAIGRPGPLGEEDDRYPVPQRGPAAFHRLDGAGAEATLDGNVARHPHHPSNQRDLQDLDLREPLHFEGEMADEQDIGERLVVRDDDVGVSRVVDRMPARRKLQ